MLEDTAPIVLVYDCAFYVLIGAFPLQNYATTRHYLDDTPTLQGLSLGFTVTISGQWQYQTLPGQYQALPRHYQGNTS